MSFAKIFAIPFADYLINNDSIIENSRITIKATDVETEEDRRFLIQQVYGKLKGRIVQQLTKGLIGVIASLSYVVLVIKIAYPILMTNSNKNFVAEILTALVAPGLIGMAYSIYLIGQGLIGFYQQKHKINFAEQAVFAARDYIERSKSTLYPSIIIDLAKFNSKKGSLDFTNGLSGYRMIYMSSSMRQPEVRKAILKSLRQYDLASVDDYINHKAVTVRDEEWKVLARRLEDNELFERFQRRNDRLGTPDLKSPEEQLRDYRLHNKYDFER